jgi:hypothetical protein
LTAEKQFTGRSVSLPIQYWEILESIQRSLSDPSLSQTIKRVLDVWLFEHGFLEKDLGEANTMIARKALRLPSERRG